MTRARLAQTFAVTAAAIAAGQAQASFHLMQIQQVIGGVSGDTTAQAIQLRYRSPSQCFLDPARLRVRDAAGANPILLFDFSVCPAFPTPCTTGCSTGDTVLLISPGMAAYLDPAITPDFTLTALIPQSYLSAGTLTFESNTGIVYWRLSWGGASYTGSNEGAIDNDDSNPGNFGPPWPGALPSTSDVALLFENAANAESTTNANDYSLTAGPAVFTNNSDQTSTVTKPPDCAWDCDGSGDGNVTVIDLLALLGQYDPQSPAVCVGGSCDFNADGCVDVVDLLKLLGHYAPSGTGCP